MDYDIIGCISNCRKNAYLCIEQKQIKIMTKEEFIELLSSRYEEIKDLYKLDNFYDYEKKFRYHMAGDGTNVFGKFLARKWVYK